jgi:hypothetical protein
MVRFDNYKALYQKKESEAGSSLDGYSPREKAFIINLSIKNNQSIKKSKSEFIKRVQGKDKLFHKLVKETEDYIKDRYPVHTGRAYQGDRRIGQNQNIQEEYRASEIAKKRETTKSKTNKQKYTNAAKKYPDASAYELRYGVNSKKSQEYRLRHGESKEYTGRIVVKKGKK